MKKTNLALIWFLSIVHYFLVFADSPVHSQDLPSLTIGGVDIQAQVAVSSDLFTYSYTISNPIVNTGTITHLDIDVRKPSGTIDLSGEGLTHGPDFFKTVSAARIRELSEEEGLSLIPVGVSGPQAWGYGVGGTGTVGWGAGNDPYDILPGQSLDGFQIVSRGLPGVRVVKVIPDYWPEPVDSVSEEDIDKLVEIEAQITFTTKTLGPTAPPLVFDPLVFTETIQGYITESQSLGWLTDAGLVATLNGHLDAVTTGLSSGDMGATKVAVQSFIDALPVPPAGNTACTSECSSVLYFNAQYLLSQLPDQNRPPVAVAGTDQTVECVGVNGASVMLDGSGSTDPDGDVLTYVWTGDFGTVQGVNHMVVLPVGVHTVTLTASDGQATATDATVITVTDTQAPLIASVTATPSELWPPNHRMVPVLISVFAFDICDAAEPICRAMDAAAPVCKVVFVASNEPENGRRDGDTAPDWEITGNLRVRLRAERSRIGSGRTYTITTACADATGNPSTATVTVTVPHDQRKK